MGLLHRLWQQIQSQSQPKSNQVVVEGRYNVVPHFIQGERYVSEHEEALKVYNPLIGQAERCLYNAGPKEVEYAVQSALNAFNEWQFTPVIQRIRILKQFRELLIASHQDLKSIIMQEEGVTQEMALEDIHNALNILDDVPRWRDLLTQKIRSSIQPEGYYIKTTRQSVGVVVGVESGRLCVSSIIWMLCHAISCGNSIIVKPSIHHPSIAIFIADLLERSELPKGVFNVLQGDKSVSELLLKQKDVSAFIYHQAYDEEVPTALYEAALHAFVAIVKNAHVAALVFEDADVQKTAQKIVEGFYKGCQSEQAISTVIVIGNHTEVSLAIKDHFEDTYQSAIENRISGSHTEPLIPGVFSSEGRYEYAKNVIQKFKESEMHILSDFSSSSDEVPGWYVGPILADFVKPDNEIFTNEISVPVLCVLRVNTWDDAKAIIQKVKFNSVGIFTSSLNQALQKEKELTQRYVGINTLVQFPVFEIGIAGKGMEETLHFFTHARESLAGETYE